MKKINTSTLLTVAGLALGVTTNIIVAKRTDLYIKRCRYTSVDKLGAIKEENPDVTECELTKKEKATIAAKVYWPALITGGLATTSILLSKKIDVKQIAMLGGTLAIANKKLRNCELEAEKYLGKEKTESIKKFINTRVMNDITAEVEPKKRKALKDDEFIFVDSVTGASFISTLEKVEEAEKDVSAEYERDGDANWTDLEYLATGKGFWAKSMNGEYLGWSHEMYSQFYGSHNPHTDDGLEVDIDNLTFENTPIINEAGEIEYYFIEPSLIPEYGYFEY